MYLIEILSCPGIAENWRQASIDYYRDHKRNYFNDIISIHESLGLAVRYKTATAIATLVSLLAHILYNVAYV